MEHDFRLRAAAREIYNACYPTDDWATLSFPDAERYGTIHYRQAVGAAQRVCAVLADDAVQPELFERRSA